MVKLIEERDLKEGKLRCFELKNENGMIAEIINYGARIHRLIMSDINGVKRDVVIGFHDIAEYVGSADYFNAIVGRVANRIGGAAFTLNGKNYPLFKNDGNNHLHGGKVGFDSVFWNAEIDGEDLALSYTAADLEEGYPAELSVEVRYRVTENDELSISYRAQAKEDTLCSLTNHAYFNLSGDFNQTVLGECLRIKSDCITAIDKELIPTGELYAVKDTPLDFNSMREIGEEIGYDNEFLRIAGGYDFNYVLKNDKKSYVAKAFDPKTCIEMEVYTDMLCMQFYSGNFLNGTKGKAVFNKNCAFCLETQLYPNACNVSAFPSSVLKKGEIFSSQTKYKFSLFRSEF
ncbi:MAG: galactose-1-epimerase [Bacillota bacterium]|nr:MAG: galactose-1-epimerase [Bacillota bacterium]